MPTPIAHYAVFGNPIAHSKSPQIHQQFAAQEGVIIQYERILVEHDNFHTAASHFFAHGGQGANVTVPFKTDAYQWVNQHSARAQTAGAVNTLIPLADGSFLGDNTDGIGLVNDIMQHYHQTLRNKKILLLGAGGAVRGVLQAIIEQQPSSLTISNRTLSKAQALAQQFQVEALPIADLPANHYDIIINGTSSSLTDDLPTIPPQVLGHCTFAYDMVYSHQLTPFLHFAQHHGAQYIADGLGMLVAQAAYAYQLWRGFMPNIAPVIQSMRENMSC